jgi:hypothetical protein
MLQTEIDNWLADLGLIVNRSSMATNARETP